MKRIIIAIAFCSWSIFAQAQTSTTYGSTDLQSIDAGYVSDYSTDGTTVLTGGSITLANGATYEHGNLSFQNDGSWISQTNSLDLFNAPGSMTINGSVAPQFYDLQLQNAGLVDINNSNGALIAGELSFGTSMSVNTVRANHSIGALSFSNDATYTGGTTDLQHVNGYVSKTGDDAFVFPVGSGSDIRTLSISAPALVTDQFSVAWINGDPTTNADPSDAGALHPTSALDGSILSVSNLGQWDWVAVSGSGAGLTIAVSLPDGLDASVTATDLRLVGWNGIAWTDLSGGSTATGITEGSTLSGTMVAGITAIGIGSTSTVLPVTFNSFTAAKSNCEALLHWSTTMEHNNDYFQVERSVDGRNFSIIGKVDATGNSSDLQQYTFTDNSPATGVNHYRIAQVDIDGKRSSTSVNSLWFDCSAGLVKVYPTLTNGLVTVELPAGYETAEVYVTDISGRKIAIDMALTGLLRSVQFSHLAAGIYILTVNIESRTETFKIIYQP